MKRFGTVGMMLFMVIAVAFIAIGCSKKAADTSAPAVVAKEAPAPAVVKQATKVYGLEKSVSEYAFVRGLEKLGKNPQDYTFANMDPGAAAQAMQQKQAGVEAIVVWNPFVLDTVEKRPDTHVLFDSTLIPAEIIDMVVVAQASLDKLGGGDFAKAVAATYYAVNQRLADPATHDATLVAIGEKFSSLKLATMEKVVQQTLFYKSPEWGIGLFSGGDAFPFKAGVTTEGFPTTITPRVVDFCVSRGIVERKPLIVFGAKSAAVADVRFTTEYMQEVKDAPKATDAAIAQACDFPSFSLAWSEYPSWSVFGVAHVQELINGEPGECGPIERAYGVDIVLKEMEYDPCISSYASGAVDAVCITNMDVLSPSLGRPSVAIMPTSTSYGADALIVPKTITDVTQLAK